MSRFDPVHLPEDRKLNGKVSMTFLRHFTCPRSAYFYQSTKGSAQNVAMARGSALHAVCERATKLMIEQGERIVPPELVKDIVNEVLAEHPVPIEEHDRIREMSYRWAMEWTIEPANVIACETMYVLDVRGWQVRCKVDFAELRDNGRQLFVADYKSGLGIPAYDDVARKRADGTMSMKNLQLIVYALAIKYGKPVRIEADVEITEESSRGARAQEVIGQFVFPAVEDAEGRMFRRTMGLTPLELSEYLESMIVLLARVGEAERTGDWPAIISNDACAQCPAPSQCPIPAQLRDHNGTITDIDQAALLLEAADVQSKETAAIRRGVKAFAKEHDVEIRFGKDKVARFVPSKTERVDKEAVRLAIANGEPPAPDVISTSEGTGFKDCTLTEEELANG